MNTSYERVYHGRRETARESEVTNMENTSKTRIEKLLELAGLTRNTDDAGAEETLRVAMAMQVGYELGRAERKSA